MRLKNSTERNGWLLIKQHDQYATAEDYDSNIFTAENSPINNAMKKNDDE